MLSLNIANASIKNLKKDDQETNKIGKFLIVANGSFNEDLVKKSIKDRVVIALDGAFKNLSRIGIFPTYVLGDFDSIKEEQEIDFNIKDVFSYFKKIDKPNDEELRFEEYRFNDDLSFIRAASQNYTDLDKGIEFAIKKGAKDIKILCALEGNRTDHLLHNISILKKFHYANVLIYIETQKEIIQFLKNEEIEFRGTPGAKLGLFGFPEAKAVSQGLLWELNKDYILRPGFQDSSGNELKHSLIKISIEGEAILIRPNY